MSTADPEPKGYGTEDHCRCDDDPETCPVHPPDMAFEDADPKLTGKILTTLRQTGDPSYVTPERMDEWRQVHSKLVEIYGPPPEIEANLDPDFYAAYESLSRKGWCDSPGGAEYQRVLREWNEADCPDEIGEFIRIRANVGPYDTSDPDNWRKLDTEEAVT